MVVVTAEARESTVDCEKPLRMAMCGQAGPPELATVDGGSTLDHTGCRGLLQSPPEAVGSLLCYAPLKTLRFGPPRPAPPLQYVARTGYDGAYLPLRIGKGYPASPLESFLFLQVGSGAVWRPMFLLRLSRVPA